MLDRRLLLVTGKGGTGKSAIAASLAIAAGRRGMRVLALAVDTGTGLAGHLGAPPPGATPQRCGDVHLAAVEPAAALEEYLRIRVRVPRLSAAARVFSAVVDTAPGIRDTMVIGKVVDDSSQPHWDLVVADAPPIGQIGSLLFAPEIIAGLVPGGAVRRQAEWLRSMLADASHTGVVVTATPEELAVTEAVAMRTDLTTTRVAACAATVANKVLEDPGFADAAGAATDEARQAAELHLGLLRRQIPALAALAPTHLVPFMFGMRTPVETAERIAGIWEDS